jgi:hypothetical protein
MKFLETELFIQIGILNSILPLSLSHHTLLSARSFPQYRTHTAQRTSKINHHHHGGHFNSPATSNSQSQTPPSPRLTPQTSSHKMATLWSRRTTPSPPLTPFFHCRRLAASAEQVGGCPCHLFEAKAHLSASPTAQQWYRSSTATGER